MDRLERSGVTRLILVRHGETEAGAQGRCVGRLDVMLSDLGRSQARGLVEALRELGPSAVYASPSRRAVDTAAPTAAACGLSVHTMEELCEVSFGALEGLAFEEVEARFPEAWGEWMSSPATVRFPGGESLAHVQARVRRARAVLLSRHAGQTVAAFSHAGPMRALLGDALVLREDQLFELRIPHAAPIVLEWPPGRGGLPGGTVPKQPDAPKPWVLVARGPKRPCPGYGCALSRVPRRRGAR